MVRTALFAIYKRAAASHYVFNAKVSGYTISTSQLLFLNRSLLARIYFNSLVAKICSRGLLTEIDTQSRLALDMKSKSAGFDYLVKSC